MGRETLLVSTMQFPGRHGAIGGGAAWSVCYRALLCAVETWIAIVVAATRDIPTLHYKQGRCGGGFKSL